jgi:hypothetical protein
MPLPVTRTKRSIDIRFLLTPSSPYSFMHFIGYRSFLTAKLERPLSNLLASLLFKLSVGIGNDFQLANAIITFPDFDFKS